MARLTIASGARTDLRDIRHYSKAVFGPVVARAYLEGLRERFVSILTRPLAGRSEADIGDDIRSVGYRSHRIYYKVEGQGVTIIRLLHHAQDVNRAFEVGG